MKVLTGPPEPKPYQFTCNNCTSKLEATFKDVNRWGDERGGSLFAVLVCIVCTKENFVDVSLLPHWRIAWNLKLLGI